MPKRTARLILLYTNPHKNQGVILIIDQKKQNATFKRYHDKTYKKYALALRIKEHADIIEQIENGKKNGISPTQTVVEMFRKK